MTETPQDEPQTETTPSDPTEPKLGINDATPGENDTDEPLTSM